MNLPSTIALIVYLIVASWFDLQTRRIPNKLNLIAAIVAIIIVIINEVYSISSASAVLGMVIATSIMFILYLCGGVGGGDVKLAFIAGLLAGYPKIIELLFYGSLVALILILGRLSYRGELGSTAKILFRQSPKLIHPNPNERNEQQEKIVKRSVSFAFSMLVALGWIFILTTVVKL